MKQRSFSRVLSLLLVLAMVFAMAPAPARAADSATYIRVTEAPADWAGEYLLVYEAGGLALDGSLSSPDVVNNYTAVSITDSSITMDDHSKAVYLEAVDGGYVLKTAAGLYLYHSSDANKLSSTANKDTAAKYPLTVTVTEEGTDLALSVGPHLRFNANADQMRFRYYKSSSYTNQQPVALYKLEGEGGTQEPEIPEVTAPFADGDQVVIYAPAYGKALSAEKTGYYNVGVDVTLDNGVLSGYGESSTWTVTDNGDGTWSFGNGGQNIGLADSYSSMDLGAVNDAWELVDLGGGLYNVKNTVRGNYMEWYAQYSNWSTYASDSAATDDQFQLSFYVIPAEEEPAAPFKSGDQVVIYAPAYGKALSAEKTGYYNVGVDVTLDNGVLSGYGESSTWTVTDNGDGTWSFGNGGQNIGLADSYSSMDLGAVNDDWQLIDLGSGLYNVKNSVRGNYMEWYAQYSNWSTYASDSAATDDQFQLSFYVVPQEDEGILSEGDRVVIYNPAHMKALSTTYNGFYNNGTDVSFSGDALTGFTGEDVWTVGVNSDGTYTFSTAGGQKLSMGAQYSSMPLDDVNTAWEVTPAATADCFYIKNAVRGSYIEWYAEKNNWSSYYNIGSNEALFAQAFWKVEGDLPETGKLPNEGDQVMLYNVSAKGVLALENDTTAINNALATVENGVVTSENGGLVFTVEKNGTYYRFKNETFGYLCSNGTGNNAFYSLEASDDADWTLAEYNGGWSLESRTAKYNGTYSQYLEYYADSYKTYSMYNVTDPDIYTFHFYPCGNAEGDVIGGVVNAPAVDFGTVLEAAVNVEYSLSFTVEAVFGVKELTAVLAETPLEVTEAAGVYTAVIPAESVVGESLTVTVSGVDNKEVPFSGTVVIPVKDEPVIGDVTPANGTETLDNKRPEISAAITNAGENAVITMTVNGEEVAAVYENGILTYTPAQDMADGNVTVKVTVVRADGKTAEKTWRFTVGEAQFQLYFGQLHAHTTYSDGAGSLESALDYIAQLPDSANVDFVAFTDHSNYFDQSGAANPEQALYDMSLATSYSQNLWSKYKGDIAAFNEGQSDVVAIGGFEMTWSGGPGHINTFNTPGIVSRNNTTLNNKTADAGMKAYYALLSQAEGIDSISQFNHPGSTFGTFTDFAYWDAVIDSRIQLVEVGNGEGQIGAGGYYPSYEYYTMALDKGWHVSPTNNQDNHKGKWGNANNARDVILAESLSEESIYEAIRAMRMYATEDKNLEIYYTVNGQQLGSSITEVPEKLNLNVTVSDPDAADTISKVEVIVNSGKTAYTWDDPAVLASGELSVELDPTYSYYYIRVTQGDGDLAVTTPVWVGESLKLGISSLVSGTSTPVTDEELTLTTTLFNSESSEATVKTITYSAKGGQVLGVDNTGYTVPASGTLAIDWAYTPAEAKVFTITATVVMELDGEEYVFTMDIELDVQDADKLVYIGVDASHYNEYVNGNYKDSMGNFGGLAAEYSVRLVTLYSSEDLIAACGNEKYKAIILTAPSRRLPAAQEALLTYTAEETAAIQAFNKAGGMVILAGWSDYYENYPNVASIAGMDPQQHMAATQNTLLEALGSSLRITDDATHDNELNGGQTQRLYFNAYNFDSFLVDGVEVDEANPNDRLYTEVYSQYGGATIHVVDESGNMTAAVPETVTAVVFGHTSTYSKDSDNDGIGGDSVTKYTYAEGDDRLLVLATEQLDGQGLIVVSGAAFMSNFEVQATIEDSGSEKNYSNYKICENLLKAINPVSVTDIAEVAAQTEAGYKYTIEGVVTSNASGYDRNTAFFDCIYVQDATGGICCFPVAGDYKVGDIVRITGVTEFYQGEPELQVTSIEKIGETDPLEPKVVTAAQINDRSVEGQLVTLSGTVLSFEIVNGLVQTIMVQDESGNVARVFIDGYITVDSEVQNLAVGAAITVTGCASYDDTFNAPEGPFPRIRVRDRADVVCVYHDCPSAAFADLNVERWYHDYTDYVIENGLMKGMTETSFGPDTAATRGMLVTVLYRMAGSPEVETEAPFTDVADDRYYAAAIDWAYGIGIAKGMTDTLFAPEAELTREQAAAFLYRYLASSVAPLNETTFPDWEDVSDYAEAAMTWAVAAGLFEGYEDGTLRPKDGLTRVQAAKLLTIIDTDF